MRRTAPQRPVPYGRCRRLIRDVVVAGLAGCVAAGCSVVGPTVISQGRLAYNEAIARTDGQQMLMAVVKARYLEPASLLAVASITANISVSTSANFEIGFGPEDNYLGNLVPLTAGAIYEENPTISYAPVASAAYLRKLLAPTPISVLAQTSGTAIGPAFVLDTLVASVNRVQNPDFVVPGHGDDAAYGRFVAIVAQLFRSRRLFWAESDERPGSFSMVIEDYAPDATDEVVELLGLVGLPAAAVDGAPIVLPVALALDGRGFGGLGLKTRSVGDLVQLLSAAVDVPERDLQSGAATRFPPLGPRLRALDVRRAATRPESASTAVEYRGAWYYIDDTDQATKRFFQLLSALWSVTIADSAPAGSAAPVLTVPVSR